MQGLAAAVAVPHRYVALGVGLVCCAMCAWAYEKGVKDGKHAKRKQRKKKAPASSGKGAPPAIHRAALPPSTEPPSPPPLLLGLLLLRTAPFTGCKPGHE